MPRQTHLVRVTKVQRPVFETSLILNKNTLTKTIPSIKLIFPSNIVKHEHNNKTKRQKKVISMRSSDDIVNFDATISHARLKLHFVFAVEFKFSLSIHYSQSKIFFDCKNTLDISKAHKNPDRKTCARAVKAAVKF